MRSKGRLAVVLVVLCVAGFLVWHLRRGGSATERAGPARGATVPEERATTESPEAPPSAGGAQEGEPAAPPDKKEQGIRVRVVAEGRAVADACVAALAGDTVHELANEGEGAYFAGATGKMTVGATHALYGPVRREVEAPAGAVTEVTLDLPAGATLDVVAVTDRGGAPVAGASVHVVRAGGPALEGGNGALDDPFEEAEADVDFSVLGELDLTDFMLLGGLPAAATPKLVTDANGRARVAGLPPGTVDLVVSHKDFVATRLRQQPVGRESVARLSAGGSLTVLAPYVEGRAAEGYLCGAARPRLMFSMPVASARVDALGKAFFPHVPPGPLKIFVAKARHPLALMGLAVGGSSAEYVEEEEGKVPAEGERKKQEVKKIAEGTVTIIAGEHATLDLRETKGARIEGVLVAGDEAREGAMVLLLSGEKQVGTQQTGERGEFAFEGVAPGKYRLTAGGWTGGNARAECEVREGDAVVTVRLEYPVGAIAGRVLGADGKPAAEAHVLVRPREAPPTAASLEELMEFGFALTDEEGRFRVSGIAPGDYLVLGGAGRRLDAIPVKLHGGEEAQVELRVDDARVRRLLVRLRGPDGPVEGSVFVLGHDGSAAEMLALTSEEEFVEPRRAATHEFFLAPGRYRIVATSAGLAPSLGEAVDVAGDREITLTLGPGVRVELSFEGQEGPLAHRDVDVRNEHGIRLDGHSGFEMLVGASGRRTDGAGILTLDAVPPGRYSVLADGKEICRVEVGAAPVAKRIRVE